MCILLSLKNASMLFDILNLTFSVTYVDKQYFWFSDSVYS